MASTVYTTEEIELRDGQTVVLAPLSITMLRKFMKKFEELGKLDEKEDLDFEDREDAIFDILIALGIIGLKGCKVTIPEKTEDAEDMLDLPTVHRIIKVCGGIDLDPKLSLETTNLAVETPGQN